MERSSLSVEKAIECFIFECSCSNMIVAYTDKKKESGRKNTQCQPLCCPTRTIYTCKVCTQSHTHSALLTVWHMHTHTHTHILPPIQWPTRTTHKVKPPIENDSPFKSEHDLLQVLCLRTELMHVGIPVIHCLLGLSTLHVAPPFYTHSVSDHEGEYHIFNF